MNDKAVRPTADPELAELFDRAKDAWLRWKHRQPEQAVLPIRTREAR